MQYHVYFSLVCPPPSTPNAYVLNVEGARPPATVPTFRQFRHTTPQREAGVATAASPIERYRRIHLHPNEARWNIQAARMKNQC